MSRKTDNDTPSLALSLIPLGVLVVFLALAIHLFGGDAIMGGSQFSLLTASAVCAALAIWRYGRSWQQLEDAIVENMHSATPAIIILLLIGAIAGTWMASGVIPTMIYYGLKILHPSIFLLASCVICAVISLLTGSSWTTVATIGVALMGIGRALGFEDGWIAGAIISGAYFGDKISLMSDTTVLASSTARVPIFTHIKYMLLTTVPSMAIALAVFGAAGFVAAPDDAIGVQSIEQALASTYRISPWLLVVPVVTGLLIARKLPAIITLFASVAIASVAMVAFQPDIVEHIAGTAEAWLAPFKAMILAATTDTAVETGDPLLNDLVATSGMSGMLDTVWLIICAMCFGGAMTASGMLGSITSVFVRFMKNTFSMVTSTVASGLFLNLATADQYISIILTGNMFGNIYKKRGYESRLLSRTTEDAVTVTSPLIPWNTCGMTQATILSVPTLVYLPYCFFNIISPLMSICIAAIGYRIYKKKEDNNA